MGSSDWSDKQDHLSPPHSLHHSYNFQKCIQLEPQQPTYGPEQWVEVIDWDEQWAKRKPCQIRPTLQTNDFVQDNDVIYIYRATRYFLVFY